MTRPDDDTLLIAYVYDELPPSEREAFEARLAADPSLRAEVEGLLATRSLLGADARFGEQSGLDEPPPHLRNAILQAEQLARPREIRAAAASAAPQGFLLRLSSWWVGAGLAASAAAAVLLLVREAPEAQGFGAAPSSLAKAAPADALAQEVATPAPAPALEPQAVAQRQAAKDEGGEMPAAFAETPATAPPEGVAAAVVGGSGERALWGGRGGFGGGGVAVAAQNDVALNFAGSGTGADFDDSNASAGAAAPSGAGPKGHVETSSLAEAEMPFADESAKERDSLSEEKASRAGFAPPAAAPTVPATSSPVRLPGPPPLPAAVKAELARGRAAAKKRDESRRKQKAAAPPAAEPGEFAGSLAAQLEQGLLAGAQELAAGRPTEALDIFRGVASRDPRGVFVGVAANVGQMRALVALRRPKEALVLLPLVKRPGPRAAGVSEGVKVAAEAAEQLGDIPLAVSLYRELQRDPVHRDDAVRALARLQGQGQGYAPATPAESP